jgi:hypothetical protein
MKKKQAYIGIEVIRKKRKEVGHRRNYSRSGQI